MMAATIRQAVRAASNEWIDTLVAGAVLVFAASLRRLPRVFRCRDDIRTRAAFRGEGTRLAYLRSSRLISSIFGLLLSSPAFCADPDPGTVTPVAEKECVILLHGLARTGGSLRRLAAALDGAGYVVVNMDYPSRAQPVEQLASHAVSAGLETCDEEHATAVHFVTHSLGGILVRYHLALNDLPLLGRVVMLSPPNQGSEAADRLKDWPLYRWFNGPAGQQLVTGAQGLPGQLGKVDYPVGIITGDRHSFMDSWLDEAFSGPHDGKVSVESARVEGMTDFLVLPYAHPFIMQQDEVLMQTLHFLRHGCFRREGAPSPCGSE
jgi:hypothetical protein